MNHGRQARFEARNRTRRIIVNDDAGELEHPGADTVEGFLEPKLRDLAGTQVDTICWSVLSEWGDAPSYDSRVQPVFGDAHDPPPTAGTGLFQKNLRSLIDAALCPLQITIDFAHEHGLELFASVRMNDVHDGIIESTVRTTWKKSHPELLIDTDGMLDDKNLYVTAQDYTHPEVRQRKLEIFEEVCERYDVDGFELDFFRAPVFFSPTVRAQPVTQEQIVIMTGFMRRLREMTEAASVRRQRPILLAACVPDSFELGLNIGLDVKAWLEEDLVDMLIMGRGYSSFAMSLENEVELAHRHSVPVYPCINQKPAGCEVLTAEAGLGCRALASNWFHQGADGIYIWNLGVPVTWLTPMKGPQLHDTIAKLNAKLHEIGSPETLAGLDKLFMVESGQPLHWYAHASAPWPLPVRLTHDGVTNVPLEVGDDLKTAEEIELEIRIEGQPGCDGLRLRLNGEDLGAGTVTGDGMIRYALQADQMRQGVNLFEAALGSASIASVELTGVRLEVRYR
ncbi:MAG: hypothetical protein CMJ18_12640 [Phycisphaeraceae bacterium]|nr:hypothetical protein [Phycisphaeraceae bacterium]